MSSTFAKTRQGVEIWAGPNFRPINRLNERANVSGRAQLSATLVTTARSIRGEMWGTAAPVAVPPPTIAAPSHHCHFSLPANRAARSLKSPSPQREPRLLTIVRTHSTLICRSSRGKPSVATYGDEGEGEVVRRKVLQVALWGAEAVYIFWLFLLPYAPGDPVWAISKETIDSLLCLSLNFFFILPLMNSVGIRLIDAPVLHPMAEGLFNFVIGWTFMFAPLLFTDAKKDGYRGSLDVLWSLQMFLTNSFLIPYMAIRLNETDDDGAPSELSQLGLVMTNGAPIVGLIGGGICLVSVLWALFGRMDGNFGNLGDRLDYVVNYLGSERLAYAFIWDIVLYSIFQPWLIGSNLSNVQNDKRGLVNYLRFIPVAGLTAYLLFLDKKDEA